MWLAYTRMTFTSISQGFGLLIVGVSDLAEEVDVEVVLAVVEGKALDVITHGGR